MTSQPSRHVALLRGINVGGHNKLPMKELVALCSDAGLTSVQTYIQSGNVVFDAPAKLTARLPALISAAIEQRCRLRIPVVVRSAAALAAIARDNPFLATGADPAELHVVFLDAPLAAAAHADFDAARFHPEELAAIGPDVYLRLPGGMGKSKLAVAFPGKRAAIATARNWRTVLKLVELTS